MPEQHKCERCGKLFAPYRPKQRFCPGGRCRRLAWESKHPRRRAAGQGRRRPDRFECGTAIAQLADRLVELGYGETRQKAIEAALLRLLGLEDTDE